MKFLGDIIKSIEARFYIILSFPSFYLPPNWNADVMSGASAAMLDHVVYLRISAQWLRNRSIE